MKLTIRYLSISALLLTQATSFAASNNKIIYRLEKTTASGFVTQEQATSSECILYDNGIIQSTKRAANLSTIKRDKVLLQGDLQAAINTAAQGQIATNPYPADAPSISYRAIPDKFPKNVKLASIVLYEKNGNSGQELTNNSSAAVTLRNFMDMNCQDNVTATNNSNSNTSADSAQQITGTSLSYSVLFASNVSNSSSAITI